MRRLAARVWSALTSRCFWTGVASALDLFPRARRVDGYPHISEAEALRADFDAVGGDMGRAVAKFRRMKGEDR